MGRACSSASAWRSSSMGSTDRWRAPSRSPSCCRAGRARGSILVVDFTTYVFVPAYAISASGLLPEPLAIPAGMAVVITGALYFADREMKTRDNYFRGFPAVWNLAAFYLYMLEPPAWAAAIGVAALCVLTFVANALRASPAREAFAHSQYRPDSAVGCACAFCHHPEPCAGALRRLAVGGHRGLFPYRRIFAAGLSFNLWSSPCHDPFF